jgi:hypothetical protein
MPSKETLQSPAGGRRLAADGRLRGWRRLGGWRLAVSRLAAGGFAAGGWRRLGSWRPAVSKNLAGFGRFLLVSGLTVGGGL